MTQHTVTGFDDELRTLSQILVAMGGKAEESLADSVHALARQDHSLAEHVIARDDAIDDAEREIEEKAVLTLAKRQPVAGDLREVMAAIRISSDLERIGDLAKNIAKRVLVLNQTMLPQSVMLGLENMSEKALLQLKDVLDSYTRREVDVALDVWARDQEIDAMYNSVFRELLTYMIEDPRLITGCTHLLFVAKNIERIGDHSTNIAETVHYLVTGEPLSDDRPKHDTLTDPVVADEAV